MKFADFPRKNRRNLAQLRKNHAEIQKREISRTFRGRNAVFQAFSREGNDCQQFLWTRASRQHEKREFSATKSREFREYQQKHHENHHESAEQQGNCLDFPVKPARLLRKQGIPDMTVYNTEDGKLLEETKPWKIACDLCMHKERTFVAKTKEKAALCDFHRKIQRDFMAPDRKTPTKTLKNPKKPAISLKKTAKRLKFAKLEDFAYFRNSGKENFESFEAMQLKINGLLKDLSEMYGGKRQIQEILRVLLGFLKQNLEFLDNEARNFKDFQEFFQNIGVALGISAKNQAFPANFASLLNETERLKRVFHEKRVPLEDLVGESAKMIRFLEEMLETGDFFKENGEFAGNVKENLQRMESFLRVSKEKNADYERFIANFLENDQGNDGFKNTLKALIEYKKKVDGFKGLEEDFQRKSNENSKKIAHFLRNFESLENWFKKHREIFRECEKLDFSGEIKENLEAIEGNLRFFAVFVEKFDGF